MKKNKRGNRIFLNVLKKHWALIWLVFAIVGVSAFFVVANYTGLTSVKRVITTQSTPGKMFSSNSLREVSGDSRDNVPNHRLTMKAYTVTVGNYSQDNHDKANPQPITYTLLAEINVLYGGHYYSMAELAAKPEAAAEYTRYVGIIDSGSFTITQTKDNNQDPDPAVQPFRFSSTNGFSTSFTGHLTENVPSTGQYSVSFADQQHDLPELPEIYIQITATPSGGATDALKGRLYAVEKSGEATAWNGSFQEVNVNTLNYDFYNYILKGSGKGVVTVSWNTSKFAVNPFFFNGGATFKTYEAGDLEEGEEILESGKVKRKSNGYAEMKIKVDSQDVNRYTFQLYKTEDNGSYLNPSQYIVTTFSAGEE